jgi:hypothetical protein
MFHHFSAVVHRTVLHDLASARFCIAAIRDCHFPQLHQMVSIITVW